MRIDKDIDWITSIDSQFEDCTKPKNDGRQLIELGNTVNFILKYESDLNNNTVEKLCNYLKIDFKPIEKLNQSNSREHYSSYYDKDMIDLVEKYYKFLSLFYNLIKA